MTVASTSVLPVSTGVDASALAFAVNGIGEGAALLSETSVIRRMWRPEAAAIVRALPLASAIAARRATR